MEHVWISGVIVSLNISTIYLSSSVFLYFCLTELIALIDDSEEVKARIKQSPSYSTIANYLEKLPLDIQSKIHNYSGVILYVSIDTQPTTVVPIHTERKFCPL